MGVQAEQGAAVECEDRVVEGARFVVLVEDGYGVEEVRVPGRVCSQIRDGDGDVGECGKNHDSLLRSRPLLIVDLDAVLPTPVGVSPNVSECSSYVR